ncbi:MAG: NUDIX hydrolase [Cyanobacteria bacterium P01_A01_bin.135]
MDNTQPITLRISAVALFLTEGDRPEVLLLHQMTPPEPDCWDLPGGGIEPHEPLMEGLRREVQEETGITQFEVGPIVSVTESFFDAGAGMRHAISLVYRCSISPKPTALSSQDPEVGPKGIQWLLVTDLRRADCSTRAWRSLQALELVPA